jgi:hypothetical protein
MLPYFRSFIAVFWTHILNLPSPNRCGCLSLLVHRRACMQYYSHKVIKSLRPIMHIVLTEWLYMRFGLVNGFTEHLQIIPTSNYSAITNLHTLQFIKACTKSALFAVFHSDWWWIPTVSFASMLTLLLVGNDLTLTFFSSVIRTQVEVTGGQSASLSRRQAPVWD